MRLWRIEDGGGSVHDTEVVVMAETAEEAVRLAKEAEAKLIERYPDHIDKLQYELIEEIEGPVYVVPMYGYSW